jgi:DNA-binding IclR family transcriptional regulator
VAAAVLDHNGHPVAGVAVTYPSAEARPEAVPATRRTAAALTRRLGGRQADDSMPVVPSTSAPPT